MSAQILNELVLSLLAIFGMCHAEILFHNTFGLHLQISIVTTLYTQ